MVGADSSQSRTLTDILIGEVWLCTGQSNMGVTLSGVGKVRFSIDFRWIFRPIFD